MLHSRQVLPCLTQTPNPGRHCSRKSSFVDEVQFEEKESLKYIFLLMTKWWQQTFTSSRNTSSVQPKKPKYYLRFKSSCKTNTKHCTDTNCFQVSHDCIRQMKTNKTNTNTALMIIATHSHPFKMLELSIVVVVHPTKPQSQSCMGCIQSHKQKQTSHWCEL
jgi:hypothetical protein